MTHSRAPPVAEGATTSPFEPPQGPSGKDTTMLDFFWHFLFSLVIVASIVFSLMVVCDLVRIGINHSVDDRFRKLEERLREQLKHERESEQRQRDHEERLRQIREGCASVGSST